MNHLYALIASSKEFVAKKPTQMELTLTGKLTLLFIFLASGVLSSDIYAENYNGTVSGTINGPVMIPKNAVIKVAIKDFSIGGINADYISEMTIKGKKEFPFDFELEYQYNKIDTERFYGLDVRVVRPKGVYLSNENEFVGVITHGNPTRDIKVSVSKGNMDVTPIG